MRPLLALLLAVALPALAEDGPRDLPALKAQLAQDFERGASVEQNRARWSDAEKLTGASLQPVIERAKAVQSHTGGSNLAAFEREVKSVGAALGLDETGQSRAAVVYLTRLRQAQGAQALTPQQLDAVRARLEANAGVGFGPGAAAILQSANVLGESAPFMLLGPAIGGVARLATVTGQASRDPNAVITAANGVEAENQAELAARFRTNGAVPSVPRDQPADSWFSSLWRGDAGAPSLLGRTGSFVMGVPTLSSPLRFLGDVGSSVYTGVAGTVPDVIAGSAPGPVTRRVVEPPGWQIWRPSVEVTEYHDRTGRVLRTEERELRNGTLLGGDKGAANRGALDFVADFGMAFYGSLLSPTSLVITGMPGLLSAQGTGGGAVISVTRVDDQAKKDTPVPAGTTRP